MKSTGFLLTLAETIRSEGESYGFRRGETVLGLDMGLPQHEWNTCLNAINLAKGYVATVEKHFGDVANPEIPERYQDQLASDWACIESHRHIYDLKMEPFRNPVITVSKTYDIVTDSSAKEADCAEHGFMFEEEAYSLEEAIDLILDSGATMPSASPGFDPGIWYITPDPEIDRDTGDRTSYSFHLTGSKVALRRVWEAVCGK